MKLIEASVETFSKRSTDLLFYHLIYTSQYEKAPDSGTGAEEYKPKLPFTVHDPKAPPDTPKIDWD